MGVRGQTGRKTTCPKCTELKTHQAKCNKVSYKLLSEILALTRKKELLLIFINNAIDWGCKLTCERELSVKGVLAKQDKIIGLWTKEIYETTWLNMCSLYLNNVELINYESCWKAVVTRSQEWSHTPFQYCSGSGWGTVNKLWPFQRQFKTRLIF